MAHLLDIIHPNFFSVLASPNKKTYIDCIFIIYRAIDSIEDSFQGDREFIVSKLVDYFDDQSEAVVDALEGESTNTSRQKATHVINILKRNGWLGEEELGDYKTSLNLFDYTIRIIDVLDDIVQGNQNEYTGEIFTVYSLINAFNLEEGIGVLEQAYQKTNDITRKLKALKANIYRYYFDITKKQSKQDLQRLLEKLLIEYKQNFFDSAYYNLKTKDSLPRYKRGILTGVSGIMNNEAVMDHLAKQVQKLKRFESYDDAFDYVENRLRFITDSFVALEHLILAIDRKNEQYISAAASKILFLTNHSEDIEGVFNRLFKIVIGKNEIDFNQILRLIQIKNLDTQSLYNQRRLRVETIPEAIVFDDDFISDEHRKRKLDAILKNNIYSKVEINKHVELLLKDKDYIEAAHVPMEIQEDYVRLILIFLYSKSLGMHYDVELLDHDCQNNFVSFKNFKIIRKGRKHE